MLNRIIIIGRLTRDPELRYTADGIPVAQMGVAVDRNRKTRDGEKQTDFIDVVAWRQSAEFASNYLTKGRLVAVEGRLQIRDWVAQDGTKRRSAEIVADNLQGLDRPREGSAPAGSGYSPAPSPSEGEAEFTDVGAYEDDPFHDE
ncbi:MAG: single-stranded DNA-binding protein [Armatimonadetes bacterium]|nr:single-stranded DNA-binding protein [Armatimonadota bacterium]